MWKASVGTDFYPVIFVQKEKKKRKIEKMEAWILDYSVRVTSLWFCLVSIIPNVLFRVKEEEEWRKHEIKSVISMKDRRSDLVNSDKEEVKRLVGC